MEGIDGMYGVGVSIETEPKGGQESGNKTRQTPRSLFKQTCPEFSNVFYARASSLSRRFVIARFGPACSCAIYTRKSSEEGLEQDFNSLDAQREAGEAFIASQKHEGWTALKEMYNDGGFSGATIERPAFQRLLADVGKGRIDVVVVYKVDRLTRSLSDFV